MYLLSMAEYAKRPYRSEFPDSTEPARSHQTLEEALDCCRWIVHARYREDNDYGRSGDYLHDATRGIITNRNTGYRWILHRERSEVEFQTARMFEDRVAEEQIEPYLSVEEAEALACAAKSAQVRDRRQRALTDQALEQIGILCRRVRESVRLGDEHVGSWARRIPRWECCKPEEPEAARQVEERPAPQPVEKEEMSLKDAAKILGKARNTLFAWYKAGKFPPAVERKDRWSNRVTIVVPRYRLDAWLGGERMPATLEEVFAFHHLHEPPWLALSVRKGAARQDVEFWIERRKLRPAISKSGKRIYGQDLEEGKAYELFEAED